MMPLPFKHLRLDTTNSRAFRLLELLPSRDLKGPIRCKLHQRTLDDNIHYEALSYAWGEPSPKPNIYINGSNVLGVTKNCFEALFHLRQRFRPRTIWVDAVCIDQNENDDSTRERNHQVKVMFEIYARATRVLIWLGCAKPGTARTMARLRLIGMAMEASDRLVPVSDGLWRERYQRSLLDPDHGQSISQFPLITKVKHSVLGPLVKALLHGMGRFSPFSVNFVPLS